MYSLIECIGCALLFLSMMVSCCRKKTLNIDKSNMPRFLSLSDDSEKNEKEKSKPVQSDERRMDACIEDRTQSLVSEMKSSQKSKKELPDKSSILPVVSTMQAESEVKRALTNIPQHNFRTVDKEAFLKMFHESEDQNEAEAVEQSNRRKCHKNKVVRINENKLEVYETKDEPTIETETTQSSRHSVRNNDAH